MAHVTESADENGNSKWNRNLDDCTKTSTATRHNSMTVSPITGTSVTVNFSLEAELDCPDGGTLRIVDSRSSENNEPNVLGGLSEQIGSQDIKKAVDGGFSYTFDTSNYNRTEENEMYSGTEALGPIIYVELVYTPADSNVLTRVLQAQASNPFYQSKT